MLDAENILLQRFITKGDPEAFGEIVHRHAGLVYGASWRVLQDRDKAADVVQDTFLQLLRNAGSITGSVPAWLHRVATNKAIDLIRKEGVRRRQEKEVAAEQPMNVNSWDDLSPYVDEELNKLDDQTRDVLIQHFFEGLTTRDIGANMRISQATVSRRLESGVVIMREGLRRRGVIIAIPLLLSLLGSKAVEAAPAFLLKELGKMAIVGAGAVLPAASTSAAQAAASGLLTGVKLKVVTMAAVAVVGVGSVATYTYVSGMSKSQKISADEEYQLDPAHKRRSVSSVRTASVAPAGRPSAVIQTSQDAPQPAPSTPGPNNTTGRPNSSEPQLADSAAGQSGSENSAVASAGESTSGTAANGQPAGENSGEQQTGDQQQMFYGGMGGGSTETESAEPNEDQEEFVP